MFPVARKMVFLALLTAFAPLASAAEGRVTFVSGGAFIERGAQKVPLRKGTLVESGDVLVTEDEGRVQWRMADDSYFALRPNSRFKIEEFSEPSSGGGGKAFYSLLKGGYRSITGLVGKNDPAAYQVKSTVVTMGVRGTDHTHVLCNDDCGWAPGNPKNGVYTRVDAGASFLSNADGSLEVKAGQYGETQSAPRLVSTAPSVFFRWAIDFAIDIEGASADLESQGRIRIEPGEIPSPSSPSQP